MSRSNAVSAARSASEAVARNCANDFRSSARLSSFTRSKSTWSSGNDGISQVTTWPEVGNGLMKGPAPKQPTLMSFVSLTGFGSVQYAHSMGTSCLVPVASPTSASY